MHAVFHVCDILFISAHRSPPYLSSLVTYCMYVTCVNSVALLRSCWSTDSARDCQPGRFVNTERLSITLPSISMSLGISVGRLLSDVPDNRTRLEHLSFTNLLLSLSRLTRCNLPTVQSSQNWYMKIQGATCATARLYVNDSHGEIIRGIREKKKLRRPPYAAHAESSKPHFTQYHRYTIYNPLNNHSVSKALTPRGSLCVCVCVSVRL